MSRRLRLLCWTAPAVAVVVALVVFGLAGNRSAANGRLAPALPRERLSGPAVTLSSLLSGGGGRPALVVFWASWCGPCAREAAADERFAESRAGRGRIVGVNWSDGLSGARAFIRHYSWSFPNVRDAEGTVGNAYRLTDLPTTFVVSASGRIKKVLLGPQSERSLEVALRDA